MFNKLLIVALILIIITSLSITALSAHNTQQVNKCIIRIEFNHGGFYNGRTQTDSVVAQDLKGLLQREFPNCDIEAVASYLKSNVFPGGSLSSDNP